MTQFTTRDAERIFKTNQQCQKIVFLAGEIYIQIVGSVFIESEYNWDGSDRLVYFRGEEG